MQKDLFEVFVIGPMGKDKDIPSENFTPISKHIDNIVEALNNVLPRVTPPYLIGKVYSPTDGAADIVPYVFNKIDGADLAIADITARSPSVMYELAYFHALGTPVIVIDNQGHDSGKTPFYLLGANIIRIEDFSVKVLEGVLEERLEKFFNPEDDQPFSSNPIENFYSAPLVEAAGASALARGYFWNLINPIINSGYGVIATQDDDNLRDFSIIIPSDNFTINEDLNRYGKIAKAWNRGERLDETEWSITFAGKQRGVTAYHIGTGIYDYPRTIGSLERSPRLKRVSGRRRPGERSIISPERLQETRQRVSKRLVEYFLDVLRDEIAEHSGELFESRIRFITLDQFEEEVGRLPRKT